MEGYLGQIEAAIARLEARIMALEGFATPEALAKLKADQDAAAAKAALDARIAAKQAEIDKEMAEMEALKNPAKAATPDDSALVAKQMRIDAMKADFERIKTEPDRQAKIAEHMKEVEALLAGPKPPVADGPDPSNPKRRSKADA